MRLPASSSFVVSGSCRKTGSDGMTPLSLQKTVFLFSVLTFNWKKIIWIISGNTREIQEKRGKVKNILFINLGCSERECVSRRTHIRIKTKQSAGNKGSKMILSGWKLTKCICKVRVNRFRWTAGHFLHVIIPGLCIVICLCATGNRVHKRW